MTDDTNTTEPQKKSLVFATVKGVVLGAASGAATSYAFDVGASKFKTGKFSWKYEPLNGALVIPIVAAYEGWSAYKYEKARNAAIDKSHAETVAQSREGGDNQKER